MCLLVLPRQCSVLLRTHLDKDLERLKATECMLGDGQSLPVRSEDPHRTQALWDLL